MDILREYELRKELRAYYTEELFEVEDIIYETGRLSNSLAFMSMEHFDEVVFDNELSPIEVAKMTNKKFDPNDEFFKLEDDYFNDGDDSTFVSYTFTEAINILLANLDRIIDVLLADESIQEKVNDDVKTILNKYKDVDKE